MVQNESSFADWKAELLHDIEAEPDTVSKGDSFVQCVLRYPQSTEKMSVAVC